MYVRGTLLHIRQGVFSHSNHLEDVAAEHTFDFVPVNLGGVVAQQLPGRAVDKDVDVGVSARISTTKSEGKIVILLTPSHACQLHLCTLQYPSNY